MAGRVRAYRLEIRSTETRPSLETQQSVLPAMSQKFGQGIEISKTELDENAAGATTIGTATTQNADLLLDVYEYLKPNDLVKIGSILASDGTGVVTRRLHEIDKDYVEGRPDLELLGQAVGNVLIRVEPDDSDGDSGGDNIGDGAGDDPIQTE